MVSSIFLSILNILKYMGGTLSFGEVVTKIIFEERRVKTGDKPSSNSVLVVEGESYVKKNKEMTMRCWKYGNSRLLKFKCHDRAKLKRTLSKMLAMSISL